MKSSAKVKKEFSTIFLSIVLVLVFVALLLILISNEVKHYSEAEELVMDGFYNEVEGIATYAASGIPWDLHESLHLGDEINENFINLNLKVQHIASYYPRANYTYTVSEDGGSYYFVLGSAGEEAIFPETTMGYLVDVIPNALVLAFSGEVTHSDGFYHDAWGRFISGYAPIFSPSGEVVAVLGVDIADEIVDEEIEKVRRKLLLRAAIIIAIGIIASLIGIYATLYLFKSHKFAKSAHDLLLQATNAAQQGAFEYDIYNDILLCGPETAKLFDYNIDPGTETYTLSKDFIVSKAVYEDKEDVDAALSMGEEKIEGLKYRKFVNLWKFHVENKVKAIKFKGYISSKDGKMKIIGMAEDYTEQEKNKVALINTNKKIQILHSISSHDIKNAITGIYAYADLILEEEGVPDNVKLATKRLIRSSEEIVSTISSFSNVYNALGTSLPEWINLRLLINNFFESHVDLKDIKFTNNADNFDIYASPQVSFAIQALFEFSIKNCNLATHILMYTSTSQGALNIIYEDDAICLSEKNKKGIFDFDISKGDDNALYIAKEILSITGISIKESGTNESGAHFVITVKPGWFRLRELE